MKKIKFLKQILDNNFEFNGDFSIDSRNLKKGDIFVAIRKGNDFVKEAIEKGCFPIYDKGEYSLGLKVENTIEYLQELARAYRLKLGAKIIAITGSNGKTTVKDILSYLLDASCTQGNYNNHIGLPLTILNCPIDAKFLVLEMGMSNIGEIALLSQIARPDYSIITNIGDSHIEFLKNRENVFKAKTELIPFTKEKVIVTADDTYLKTLENVDKVEVENILIDDNGKNFTYLNKNYHINLYGEHNAKNTALALATIKHLNYELDLNKLENLKITKMRFEIIYYGKNIVINDAYNASPKSMICSLETLDKVFKNKKKYLVLADMLELGENEISMHKSIEKTLDKIVYEKVFLYGKLMKNVKAKSAIYVDDLDEVKKIHF